MKQKKDHLLKDIPTAIKAFKDKGKDDVTISDLARLTKSAPATISKYVRILEAKGKLKTTEIGRYVLVRDIGD